MPRNSQGLYTLPPSNPVAPNTLIEAEWANATMEDIGEALTESLPRDGSAPMTGPLILRTGNPTQPREAVSKAYMEQFLAYATGMPVGAVFAFASGTTPPGYLLCNGQAVSRTTYATLFAAIGVVYGNGDGTTTFNVPDLRNEFVRGKTDTRPLGNKQEASLASHIHPVVDPTHTHAATQAAHSHSISTGGHNHGISDPGHAHNYYKGGTVAGSQYTAGSGWINNYEASGAAQTGISIAAAGDLGGSTNSVTPDVAVSAVASGVTVGAAGGDGTRPQNIALDYYIKAMSDTSGPVTLTGIETSDDNMIAIDNTNPIVPLLVHPEQRRLRYPEAGQHRQTRVGADADQQCTVPWLLRCFSRGAACYRWNHQWRLLRGVRARDIDRLRPCDFDRCSDVGRSRVATALCQRQRQQPDRLVHLDCGVRNACLRHSVYPRRDTERNECPDRHQRTRQ